MNPQQISGIVRILVAAALGPGSYLVASHVLPNDPSLIDAITTVVTVGGTAAVGYFSHQAHSPNALTAAVNSPSVPDVKVVSESSPSPAVNATNTGAIVPVPELVK